MMKRKLGTAEIPAQGIRQACEYINEHRPDLLQVDIVSLHDVGSGDYRKTIVVYWYPFE